METTRIRIAEFDLFKGVAIILVVCGHVVLKNWPGALDTHPVYTWIYSFHMPLFFFISGFLIDYTNGNRNPLKAIWKKALILLVPYFVWCYIISPFIVKTELPSLFFIIANTDPRYWFVYLLFVFSAFYYIGQFVKRGWKGVIGGGIFLLSFLTVGQMMWPCELFSRGLQFATIYILGVIASSFGLHRRVIVFREPMLSLAFACFIVCSLTYCHSEMEYMNKIYKLMASISVCYCVLYYINNHFINTDGKIVRSLSYVGKNSIVIYLTHFFFIGVFPIPVFDNQIQPFWAFCISLLLAAVIVVACLGIGMIIERFKWMNRLAYGRCW